jgi:hypothetical protein
MVAVFIYELVVNAQAQGSPVSFHVSQFYAAHWQILNSHPNAARCQPNAGTFWKCSDSGWRSLSAMYEERIRGTSDTKPTM